MSRVRARPRAILIAVGLILLVPSPAAACWCDEKPFAGIAAAADFVVIARVSSVNVLNPPDPSTKRLPTHWVATVTVERPIKGAAPEPLLVGGYASSCDYFPPPLTTGYLYALAFKRTKQTSEGWFWLEMCEFGAVAIAEPGRDGDATVSDVERWARGPVPGAK